MDFREKVLVHTRELEVSASLWLKLLVLASILLSMALTLRTQTAVASTAPMSRYESIPVDREPHNGLRDHQFAQGMVAYQSGDHQTAIWYWRQAAEQGHINAQHNLGTAYAKGEGTGADMSQAILWWRRAATQGSTDAQFNLGLIYSQGQGVEKNLAEALKWWQLAATGGDAAAQFNLGVLLAQGDGVPQNLDEGLWWLQQSANQGFVYAIKALEILGSANKTFRP